MAQTQRVTGVSTSIITEGSTTKVIYHQTSVVTFDENEIILESDGWKTHTTKLRMNQASNEFGLGFQVSQVAGKWYVGYRGERVEYEDGLRLKRS